jgi:signal peptidase I
VIMALGIVHCVTEYVADITLCEGPSMKPTIRPSGEIILVDKYSVRRYGIQDGLTAQERTRAAVKRQRMFTPSDVWHQPVIKVTDLQDQMEFSWRDAVKHVCSPLTVGDVVVAQHPARPGTVCKRVAGLPGDQILQTSGRMVTVPDGHVWLEGDNPANSSDSRSYGALPVALVQGRVVARVWPLRGLAWMRRGARPRQPAINCGSTVLPAGYNGEHIIKHVQDKVVETDEPGEKEETARKDPR